MAALDPLREALPDWARDVKLNLTALLEQPSLTAAQRWGVAVAVAANARSPKLLDALTRDARSDAGEGVVEDALAAASLMAMTNAYYRFRHLVAKPSYGNRPARLRMNRVAKPAGAKIDFELMCLAVSAINGCEACVQAHERTALEHGITEEQVHDVVRLAAVVQSAAVAIDAMSLK